MATFRVGQRVSFYDDDGVHLIVGTVESASDYGGNDVLVRISPESGDFYSFVAWEETRNGIPGKFWWTTRDELRSYGPPSTVHAISSLIVHELTK